MSASAPLRVVVVGPPLSASGGIGRIMSYALAALDDPDVQIRTLDTRGLGSSPWSSLLPLLRSCAVLVVLGALRRADVVHVNISSHGSALRKGIVVRVCRLVGLPVVLHLHASSFGEFFVSLPGWSRRWVRRTFSLAGQVIVLGQVWRTYAEDVLELPADRVTVLPNATPPATAIGPARAPGDPLRVLFLGRLGPRKGVPELLEALADRRLRDLPWQATLAGDGDVDAYRASAATMGIADRVVFPGWVGPEAVTALLGGAHVLVLPSHAEGMPMSVLEAFAAGVPVVCTPVGGLSEVVSDGGNGFLVPPGDAGGLTAALQRLLEDEALRARLGAGASATWSQDHAIDQYALLLVQIWQDTAQATHRGEDSRQLSATRG